MAKRITFEEMKLKIKGAGAKPGFNKKWYEQNYANSKSTIPMICSCGKPFELQASTLNVLSKSGKKSCKECNLELKAKVKLLEYEQLLSKIKECKCKPDFSKRWYNTNYKGIETEIPLICSCKKHFYRSYEALSENQQCASCKPPHKQFPYEKTLVRIKERGGEADFTESWYKENYEGVHTMLPLICGCGNRWEIQPEKMYGLKSLKCDACRKNEKCNASEQKMMRLMKMAKKTGATLFLDEERVRQNGINAKTPIDFICKCGNDEIRSYKYITLNDMYCSGCNQKLRKEQRKINARLRREAYLIGDAVFGFEKQDSY